jgi:Bacteriophage Mu, Gp27
MPRVTDLPPAILDEIDAWLVAHRYRRVDKLREELLARGIQVGRTALHSYALDRRRKAENDKFSDDILRAVARGR